MLYPQGLGGKACFEIGEGGDGQESTVVCISPSGQRNHALLYMTTSGPLFQFPYWLDDTSSKLYNSKKDDLQIIS